MNEYEVKIVNALLRKYYKRKSVYKDANINRRINLKVSEIFKNYSNYNVDMEKKYQVNKAIITLQNYNYITASNLKLSEDFEKIYLCIDNIKALERYASENLNITPRSFAVDELKEIIKNYKNKGAITNCYINNLENIIQNRFTQFDVIKEEDILKTIAFLENNSEFLYIREASMLIFSDSKYLENNRKSQVCSVLYNYFISNNEDIFEDENLLERFNVYETDQDICIKGPVIIEFDSSIIDIDGLSGGASFSIKDINKVKRIIVKCEKIMTIENKTSFLRMNNGDCYVYLGGFATKPQLLFIKKLIKDNSKKQYFHFGDIDAGGFWIHKKLCEQLNMHFSLYCMSKETLQDYKNKKYLKKLSKNDINRLVKLKGNPEYEDCINWMLKNECKLEQEIISLDINTNRIIK